MNIFAAGSDELRFAQCAKASQKEGVNHEKRNFGRNADEKKLPHQRVIAGRWQNTHCLNEAIFYAACTFSLDPIHLLVSQIVLQYISEAVPAVSFCCTSVFFQGRCVYQ
ncbi:hypothetical protein NE619_01375 [Anaerovorax odorimutans]|uniref:Uncharacterized protein n=1 Tax=Anaerovorax odorimutans TaxID=109327 RepID=A0ABT1RJL2_9FIRM|nr:hypothetical protein [Anaerovorax odorimutans]